MRNLFIAATAAAALSGCAGNVLDAVNPTSPSTIANEACGAIDDATAILVPRWDQLGKGDQDKVFFALSDAAAFCGPDLVSSLPIAALLSKHAVELTALSTRLVTR